MKHIFIYGTTGKGKMISFTTLNRKSYMLLYSFVVSVDEIEKMTRIDFFSKLNDVLENNLEKF